MPGIIFNSAVDDAFRGNIDFDTDTFWVMLCDSTYAPSKDAHLKRSDITNEIAAGNGYAAGGKVVTVGVVKNLANDRIEITFNDVTWAAATITARYAVYYKRRGGASNLDEVVFVNDFGANVVSTNDNFLVQASVLQFSNPT